MFTLHSRPRLFFRVPILIRLGMTFNYIILWVRIRVEVLGSVNSNHNPIHIYNRNPNTKIVPNLTRRPTPKTNYASRPRWWRWSSRVTDTITGWVGGWVVGCRVSYAPLHLLIFGHKSIVNIMKVYIERNNISGINTIPYVENHSYVPEHSMHTQEHTHVWNRSLVIPVANHSFFSGGLKWHETTHTGVKPYICHSCGKSFTLFCSLTVHRIKTFHLWFSVDNNSHSPMYSWWMKEHIRVWRLSLVIPVENHLTNMY